jgi:carbon starvation protein CstA
MTDKDARRETTCLWPCFCICARMCAAEWFALCVCVCVCLHVCFYISTCLLPFAFWPPRKFTYRAFPSQKDDITHANVISRCIESRSNCSHFVPPWKRFVVFFARRKAIIHMHTQHEHTYRARAFANLQPHKPKTMTTQKLAIYVYKCTLCKHTWKQRHWLKPLQVHVHVRTTANTCVRNHM